MKFSSLIEKFQLDIKSEWEVCEIEKKISGKYCNLAAVSFKGRIYVFGGYSNLKLFLHEYSEEGELIQDISSSAGSIPHHMRQ